MGYVGWIGTQGGEVSENGERTLESEVVRELKSLGAVPIAKASNPYPATQKKGGSDMTNIDKSGTDALGESVGEHSAVLNSLC